ncbi:cation-translocating P-type ATPase [uncultured Tateyamaria sp.]|uniref:heavy metal translocating P-type ATPase n=1 Tax=uncultured Tateyamaria sp. TaxID=455651 RepID=UPI00261FBD2B|nr:heavy metal translocating P-type ATPase [uncultured Tateyamaria sp.]
MSEQSLTFALDGVNCAGCIAKIERHISAQEGVLLARGNATVKRIRLVWDSDQQTQDSLIDQIRAVGYDALPFQIGDTAPAEPSLLPQLGLAGFAMMNIMAISFAVWAGVATDMGPGSMQFLHWISAALATPVVLYSGAVFYGPSLRALRQGAMTMDTPISIAIAITYLASLFETLRGTEHVYFDAVTALVFFLLIGRVIERALKQRSGDAAENLRNLMQIDAKREAADGRMETVPAGDLLPGDVVIVGSGERVPADGALLSDRAQMDESVITGETLPREVTKSQAVVAGAIVHTGPARMQVTHVGEDAQIGKISQMITDVVANKSAAQHRADQFARGYIPLVLGGGIAGFALWYFVLSASFADALMIAVAVLVVTCPCAAGLATPAVSARAVNMLMRTGVVVKSSDALERLSDANIVVADKTGTLSEPLPVLQTPDAEARCAAAKLAAGSAHPLAKMLCDGLDVTPLPDLREIPGRGIEAPDGARLGSAQFVGAPDTTTESSTLWYRSASGQIHGFQFCETARAGLPEMLVALDNLDMPLTLLSGDTQSSVAAFADRTGIPAHLGNAAPDDKLSFLGTEIKAGKRPLMLGDGINDAPALKAAYVSISFGGATEVAQVAADIVLVKPDLTLVPHAIQMARAARDLIGQNLTFSAIYNIVTVPLALAGYLSPLVAAILMSSSSIAVLANGLRLKIPE